MTYPSGYVARYSYNTSTGRVQSVAQDGLPANANVTWDWQGRLETIAASGAASGSYAGWSEQYEYNLLGQTTRHLSSTTIGLATTSRDMRYGYQQGAPHDGRLQWQKDQVTGAENWFTYDNIGRLSTASGLGWSQTYTYDEFGNLYAQVGTQAVDWSASLNSEKNQIGPHDAAGNSGISTPAGYPVYDHSNRLTRHLAGVI